MNAKARKRKPGQKKKQENFRTAFLWIIVILTVAVAVAAYFYYNKNPHRHETESVSTSTRVKKAESGRASKTEKELNGSWVSSADGRILEIHGHRFTLELPSVSDHEIIRGTINMSGNTVSVLYTNKKDKCAVHPGIYTLEIAKESIRFIVKNDICAGRRQIFATTWHKF
jgi:hypothetical protein